MIKRLRALLGDQTFLEAYERTGVDPAADLWPWQQLNIKLLNERPSPYACVGTFESNCLRTPLPSKTGRILNVTVCPADTNEPPRLLNYLTAPNALVSFLPSAAWVASSRWATI